MRDDWPDPMLEQYIAERQADIIRVVADGHTYFVNRGTLLLRGDVVTFTTGEDEEAALVVVRLDAISGVRIALGSFADVERRVGGQHEGRS